jgi:hypothetical protein
MSQYAWKPVWKFVPTDGSEETLDLMEVLPPTSVDAAHEPDLQSRIDVNKRGNSKGSGFRPTCKMKFEIVDTALVQYLLLIVNRLMADQIWTVYLSLDIGITYRQVQLQQKGFDGPKAIEGKTFAGAIYSIAVEGVDLIDQVPALGSGVW